VVSGATGAGAAELAIRLARWHTGAAGRRRGRLDARLLRPRGAMAMAEERPGIGARQGGDGLDGGLRGGRRV